MILLAEHDEPSLAAKKKRQHVASETATSTPKNRVWGFENYRPGQNINEPVLSAETATGSVQFSYETASGQAYYYTRDHLGSVREMMTSSGTIAARYSYDPYGRQTKVSGSLDSTFQYTSDFYYATSGLNLTYYRAYDPNIGRWLSRDPIGEDDSGRDQIYVDNNPIQYIDSRGLKKCKCGVNKFSMKSLGWYKDSNNLYDTIDIEIEFKNTGDFKPLCCIYRQYIKGHSLNSKRTSGGTPLDGKEHLDSWPYKGDDDPNPGGGSYSNQSLDPAFWSSTDEPGLHGRIPKGAIDTSLTLIGKVFDICNGNAPIAQTSITSGYKGTYPNVQTTP